MQLGLPEVHPRALLSMVSSDRITQGEGVAEVILFRSYLDLMEGKKVKMFWGEV